MTGLILTDLNFQGLGNDGLVLPYGTVSVVDYYTGLAVSTYQDTGLTILNTNPITLSASGKAKIFLKYGRYVINLKDKFGAIVWTLSDYTSSILDNQSIIDASSATAINANNASNSAALATTQAILSQGGASESTANALVCAAYANMQWAAFSILEGDFISTYANGATSIPSLSDGDFIITY